MINPQRMRRSEGYGSRSVCVCVYVCLLYTKLAVIIYLVCESIVWRSKRMISMELRVLEDPPPLDLLWHNNQLSSSVTNYYYVFHTTIGVVITYNNNIS